MSNNIFEINDIDELRAKAQKYKTRSIVFAVLFSIVTLIIIAILVILMSNDKPMNAMYGGKIKLDLDKIRCCKKRLTLRLFFCIVKKCFFQL